MVEAMLLVHGSASNFYQPTITAMAEDLLDGGYACLALNTTGHDIAWLNQSDGNYYGNAFEILDRSRMDLRAGIDYLSDLGYSRIGIFGQSMGAVKVAYYAATEDDPRVVTVIPVSPVRLSYSYYLASEDAEEFLGIIERARELVAEGRASEVMDVKFPMPQLFSAAAYLDKHGPEELYDLVRLAPRIKVPLLVVGGSLETHTRLRDIVRDVAQAAVNNPRAEYVIIEGGQHSLGNRRQESAATVLDWLASLAVPASV